MVDLRIKETLKTGAVRKPHLPFYHLVGAVFNCAYLVRLETTPTGGRKCLFIFRIHHRLSLNILRLLLSHSFNRSVLGSTILGIITQVHTENTTKCGVLR